MKYLLVILYMVSQNAFAERLNCSKKTSPLRQINSIITYNSGPKVYIWRFVKECDSEECQGGLLDFLASDHSVCSQEVNAEADCQVNVNGEFNSQLIINIECSKSTSLRFVMNDNKMGQVTCLKKSKIKKVFDVGLCEIE